MRISDWSSDVCSSDLDVGSVAALRWRANAWTRMVLGLFTPLGVLALVLASAGLAALLGSLVTQRVREIGVRRALGASTGNVVRVVIGGRSEEHTSELQSLMRISYAVFCLKKKNNEEQKQGS